MADVAGAVADDLHFDVTRARHQLLDVHVTVAERGARLGLAAFVGLIDFVEAGDGAHAAAAAAGERLDHDRSAIAQRGEKFARVVEARRRRGAAQNRHTASLGQRARLHLVAEQLEHLGARSDEGDAGEGAAAGEGGVLTEKAVAGMNRVAARFFGERDYLLAVEISSRARAAQAVRRVGLARVERSGIVVGKDRDSADSHLGGRAHDADCNLAAVGDQKTVRSHISLVSFRVR